MRRRRLRLASFSRRNPLSVLDVAGFAIGLGVTTAVLLTPTRVGAGALNPAIAGQVIAVACGLSLFFLWGEGRCQTQLQRPAGIVFGECAILAGGILALGSYAFQGVWIGSLGYAAIALVAAGAATLMAILPPFLRGREEHRILDRISAEGEFIQAEYVAPTVECPFPERWRMMDPQSAEVEVLEFLRSLVIAVKPELIVETGTFIGHSSIKMAEGLKANGFGRIVTLELDPLVFAKARENVAASGLSEWVECRNESSLEALVEGTIDLLYIDSDPGPIREQEIRRFLPQVRARGLVLAHDASSSFQSVREAALRLEREGLLSVVLLSTPRGLMVAQKREGRT